MKLHSLLSYIASAALVAFVAAVFAPHDPLIACTLFSASFCGLIMVNEYSARSRYVVTARTKAIDSAYGSPRPFFYRKGVRALSAAPHTHRLIKSELFSR